MREDEGLSIDKKPAIGQEFVHCKLSREFFSKALICKSSLLGKMSQFHFRKKKINLGFVYLFFGGWI